MCKTCRGEGEEPKKSQEEGKKTSIKKQQPEQRMNIADERKKGKGEHRGLPWKQAIQQTIALEDQERDLLLNGWPWSMAIRMEQGIRQQESIKKNLIIEPKNRI